MNTLRIYNSAHDARAAFQNMPLPRGAGWQKIMDKSIWRNKSTGATVHFIGLKADDHQRLKGMQFSKVWIDDFVDPALVPVEIRALERA